MNKSIMMGRVVKDPDLRYTQTENGELAIANFRLAVDRKFVRRGDPEADFFSCTAFIVVQLSRQKTKLFIMN